MRGSWLLLTVFTLAGCFDVEREVEVLPDGSGRVTMRIVVPDLLRRMDKQLPARIREGAAKVEGVRWSAPKEATGPDGQRAVLLTGYFPDLREVRGHGIVHRVDMAEDGGLRVVVVRDDPAGGQSPLQQIPPGMLEGAASRLLLSRLFSSLSVTERVVLPAPLRQVSEGRYTRRSETNPRAVESRIRGKDLGDLDGLREAMAEMAKESTTVECEPPAPGAQAELAAEVEKGLATPGVEPVVSPR